MATFDDIIINQNIRERPPEDEKILENVYFGVNVGENYKPVIFSIKEIASYYWWETLCFPIDMEENKIKEETINYANEITNDKVTNYKKFLEECEKYGWD